jgi:putative transposase
MTVPENAPARETMLRGSKIRIWPNQRQTQLLDLWRRRTISLWNLLLSFEQAAYSGENIRPELRWRQIWIGIVEANYEKDCNIWQNGWVRSDGSVRRAAGTGREPVAPPPEQVAKMRGKIGEEEPKLFLWERDLMALMAALKQVPLTRWIGDLPSHAAQAICKDLIKALQAMLRERKKRIGGDGGRDTGFPKFKASRYAAGSIYFANTQLAFDFEGDRVKLPNGGGWVRCEVPETIPSDAKLMGGRAWRQGEEWFLSCQWMLAKPDPLPPTHRQAGVKIAAGILLTTYDERGLSREYTMPPADQRLMRRHKLAGLKLSRCLEAQKRRKTKLAARAKNINGGKVRVRRSGGFFEASARLAKIEAAVRDRRDDFLHKLTTKVVRKFGALQVQKMEVAKMMKKPRPLSATAVAPTADEKPKRRSLKPVRKLMRHVAMARCRQLLEYKARDLGRDYGETDSLFPDVQLCSRCQHRNPKMKDGRRVLRCDGCGARVTRNRNAAANERDLLRERLKGSEGEMAGRQHGDGRMGMHKHGTHGHSGKSPKLRHAMKRQSEKDEIKDRSRIRNPSSSVHDLFNQKDRPK